MFSLLIHPDISKGICVRCLYSVIVALTLWWWSVSEQQPGRKEQTHSEELIIEIMLSSIQCQYLMELFIFRLSMENHIWNPCPDYSFTLNLAIAVITILIRVFVGPMAGFL